ncbi:MAG: hypothetical protein IJF49_03480 [Clostridia bacterium]|nr:hypothetical protein [Clostridia bacterium]
MKLSVTTRGISGRKNAIGYDDILGRCAEAALAITEHAAEYGIETMTKNHGFFSQDAARVEKPVNTVAHFKKSGELPDPLRGIAFGRKKFAVVYR